MNKLNAVSGGYGVGFGPSGVRQGRAGISRFAGTSDPAEDTTGMPRHKMLLERPEPAQSRRFMDKVIDSPAFQRVAEWVFTSVPGRLMVGAALTAVSLVERAIYGKPEETPLSQAMDRIRREEAKAIDDAVYKTLLPALPKHLQDLNQVSPAFTYEGLHKKYRHLKPNLEFYLDNGYRPPSEAVFYAIDAISRVIPRMVSQVNRGEKIPEHLAGIDPQVLKSFTLKPDGDIYAGDRLFVRKELVHALILGASEELDEEGAQRMLSWIVEALHHKPDLLLDFDARPQGDGAIVLTPAEPGRRGRPVQQLWQ